MPRPAPLTPEERRKAAIKAFGRYSGMAFQLFGACLIGVFFGRWIDAQFQLAKPVWAVLLTVLFMLAALFSIFRQLLRET